MLKIKTKLTLSQYFLANLYKNIYNAVNLIFLFSFLFLAVCFIQIKDIISAVFCFTLIFTILFIIPVLQFAAARFYYKMKYLEYFFKKDSFGYKIGDFKIEIEKDKIQKMSIQRNYIMIKVLRRKFYFIIGEKDDPGLEKKLREFSYDRFMK